MPQCVICIVCCSVRGQWPEGAWGWLSDCITDPSSLCSATASLLARSSDACTLQVNKECHWQREGTTRVCGERGEKWGQCQRDIRKRGGGGWTEAQAGDKRGNWGNRTEDRMEQKVALADQMLWSCCTQVFSKGITSENRGGGYFIYTTREQGKQKTEQKKTTVYICVNYSS